jgi:MOSC domain-containing protein YiiM
MQVSLPKGGIPKRAIPVGELTETGVAGDAWRCPFHGGRRQAILLITIEGIDELISQRFPLFPGALGENLTTRGLDRRELRIGHPFGQGTPPSS